MFTTDPDQQVSVSLDVGEIARPHPDHGKWIVTIQVYPMETRRGAQAIATAIREAISSRLNIRLEEQP